MEIEILNLLDKLNIQDAYILIIDSSVQSSTAHLELIHALNNNRQVLSNKNILVLTYQKTLIEWYKSNRPFRKEIFFALIESKHIIDPSVLNQLKLRHPSFTNKSQTTIIFWQRHFYLYSENVETYFSELETDYKSNNQPRIHCIENGIVVPLSPGKNQIGDFNNCYGGVLSPELESIEASITETHFSDKNTQIWNKPNASILFEQPVTIKDESVVYLGAFHQHFGHFLLESTSRFWALKQLEGKYKETIYISDERQFRYADLSSLLGVDTQNLQKVSAPTKYREVFVPEPSIKLHTYFTEKFKYIFDQLPRPINNANKIYLSRAHWRNGRTHGESLIEEYLAALDFEIVYPDQLSFTELIPRIRAASLVVAISGSTAHHAVFMSPTSKMVVLNRSAHVHPAQTMIGDALDVDTYYIDCYGSLFTNDWSNGPFLMTDSDPFREWMTDWYGRVPEVASKTRNQILALSSYLVAIQKIQTEKSKLSVDKVALANLKIIN
jgi:hypothetical protein